MCIQIDKVNNNAPIATCVELTMIKKECLGTSYFMQQIAITIYIVSLIHMYWGLVYNELIDACIPITVLLNHSQQTKIYFKWLLVVEKKGKTT